MEIKYKLAVTTREGGGEKWGKEGGRGKSRNMYKGLMGTDNGAGTECGSRGWTGQRRAMGGMKMNVSS